MNDEISAALSVCQLGQSGLPRVLVVDDEELFGAIVRRFLEAEGIEVYCATSTAQGFADAVRLQPDLILLDLRFPEGDGLSLCRQLRADPATIDSSIIFMTVDGSTEMKLACFGAGGVDYITKPFVPAELRARVSSALRVRQTVRELAHSALIDGLSGLWNRAYLEWRMREETARAARHQTSLSCAVFDIDHFKLVNDRYGHKAGDAAIRHIARIVRSLVRTEDCACRSGGDEIVVLLPQTPLRGAACVAERTCNEVASNALLLDDNRQLNLSVSVGIADFEGSGQNMLVVADAAMYAAKRSGQKAVGMDPADAKRGAA